MGRPRKEHKGKPRGIEDVCAAMEAAGEKPEAASDEGFRKWYARRAERELWFFSRWVLGNDFLALGDFHRRQVCPFLTDFGRGRNKLLMLPMGFLKTTIASRSLPLHVMIQRRGANLYREDLTGREMRVLLANENELKSKENLAYIKAHLENNEWFRWLWPDCCWDTPKEARRWTDTQLELPRSAIWAEASITAVGVKTGFIGRYFDIILPDDIAALEASQNPPLMERAKRWRRAARTRFYDKERGIFMGIGTHWPAAEDLYSEWKKEINVEVMIRSIVEVDERTGDETPLWPERFPLELVRKMRADTEPQEWACWFMNRPASRGYSALDWGSLREFQTDGEKIWFTENVADERTAERQRVKARNLGFVLGPYDMSMARLRTKAPSGMDADFFNHMREKYPERSGQ